MFPVPACNSPTVVPSLQNDPNPRECWGVPAEGTHLQAVSFSHRKSASRGRDRSARRPRGLQGRPEPRGGARGSQAGADRAPPGSGRETPAARGGRGGRARSPARGCARTGGGLPKELVRPGRGIHGRRTRCGGRGGRGGRGRRRGAEGKTTTCRWRRRRLFPVPNDETRGIYLRGRGVRGLGSAWTRWAFPEPENQRG